jgi:hypothetical protein
MTGAKLARKSSLCAPPSSAPSEARESVYTDRKTRIETGSTSRKEYEVSS